MFHKVKNVQPIKGMKLLVEFQDGESRIYDVAPLLDEWQPFRSLAQVPGLFEQVRVDTGGYGISWNDDIDLACDELYFGGTPIDTIFHNFSLDGARIYDQGDEVSPRIASIQEKALANQ